MAALRHRADGLFGFKRKISHAALPQTERARPPAAEGRGSADAKLQKLKDPELASMFVEAQNNIMRLNQSRIHALNELKAARKRIADLEDRLALAAENSQRQERLYQEAQEAAAAAYSQSEYQQQQASENTASASSPSPQQEAAEEPYVMIAYGTGWDNAYIHFRTQNQDWTKVPGERMQQGSGSFQGSKVASISGGHVEFVLNNGSNDWDTPDPHGGRKNYWIDSPGTYYLKSGRLQKLS